MFPGPHILFGEQAALQYPSRDEKRRLQSASHCLSLTSFSSPNSSPTSLPAEDSVCLDCDEASRSQSSQPYWTVPVVPRWWRIPRAVDAVYLEGYYGTTEQRAWIGQSPSREAVRLVRPHRWHKHRGVSVCDCPLMARLTRQSYRNHAWEAQHGCG